MSKSISAEQAIDLIIGWLDVVEVRGHKNIVAMAKSLDMLAKVKEFVHEDPKPDPVEPVVELEPVEDPDQHE